ncbi:DUF6894 family protein [Microvirga sp. P5_D2]
MDIYYFHIRDDIGVVEDLDGIELPSRTALLMEAIRSADEFAREVAPRRKMRLEIADAAGRTVLVTPVQEDLLSWELFARLSAIEGLIH